MLRVKKISMRQIRRYFKNREGTAAIEFAILAIPFFMLLFAILELAIVFFINSTLTHSVSEASRQIRTGNFQACGSQDKFKELVCANMQGLGNCEKRLRIVRLLSATTAFKNEEFTMIKFKSLRKKSSKSFRARLSNATAAARFRNDEAGIAAIEFAFIAPVMLFMYFGIPKDKYNSVSIEIASFGRLADDSIVNRGIATLNGPFPTTFDASTLDTRILSSTSGVVVARVNYLYEPLKLRYMPTDFDLRETFMLKPRKSANVDFEDTSGGTPSTKYKCDFKDGKPDCQPNGTHS